jgi:hypothetical protein
VPFVGMTPGIPRRVTILIPPGHALLTGIALGYGHTPLLPDNQPGFFEGDDERLVFDLDNYVNGPVWSAFVYNLDYLAHGWQVRFELDEFRTGQPVTPTTALAVQDIIKAGEDLALRTQQAQDLTTSVAPAQPSPDETVPVDESAGVTT